MKNEKTVMTGEEQFQEFFDGIEKELDLKLDIGGCVDFNEFYEECEADMNFDLLIEFLDRHDSLSNYFEDDYDCCKFLLENDPSLFASTQLAYDKRFIGRLNSNILANYLSRAMNFEKIKEKEKEINIFLADLRYEV